MQKLLLIVGPTAIGKTELGIKIAQKFNGEIISGDSMQVYEELEIGTAKPSASELALVNHYLVNEKSVFEEFGVKDFVQQAEIAITEIASNNKLPIIVGGTGFYLSALIYGLQLGETMQFETNTEQEFIDELEKIGPQALWEKLNEIDPNAARKIPYQNTRRVQRALTVIKRTGKNFSSQQEHQPPTPKYDVLMIGLNSDRELIYQRINQRVDKMLTRGLEGEARFLYENLDRVHQAKQAIGYKELFPYFSGEQSLDEAIEKLKQASRKYAKRQITYFKNKLPTKWFDPLNDSNANEKITKLITKWINE